MNIIDISILAFIFINILVGMYYGFSVSLFNVASFILSWILSFLFHPFLSRWIVKKFPDLLMRIIYFSEGSSKIQFNDKILPVSSLSGDEINRIVSESGLPNPFNQNIQANLSNQNLQGLVNVGEYFDHTVANIIIRLGSFILLFVAIQLLFILIISLAKNVMEIPMLKRFDNTAAGALGFVRGLLFLFIVFAFFPLLYIIAPVDFLEQFIHGSKLIDFFINANFFTSVIKGII